jgi:amidase
MLSKLTHTLTATEIVAAVQGGEITCESVAQACLDRVAERDPDVQAWEFVDPENVLRHARAIDKNSTKGVLAGVPFGVKDIIDSGDMPSQYGSQIYSGYQPRADAACIALARKADAVLLGKTVTTEFANYQPARTRHPLDLSRTPGGSSSGSAAAVADDMVPLAIGTQTTGSTVKPASFCGVFAYRPTYADISVVGNKTSVGSFDTLGLLARSIQDIALFRDVLLNVKPAPVEELARPPRIGFCRTHLWNGLEPSTQRLFEDAAGVLRAAGATVDDITLPARFEQLNDAHRKISGFEFARNYTWEIENHWNEISEVLRNGRIKDGLNCTYEDYLDARTRAERARVQLDDIFAGYDAFLTSPVLGEAPVGHNTTGDSRMCMMWTLLHVPVVTLPVFRGPAGMPIGLQLVARRNSDRHLFNIAHWVLRFLV